MVSCELITGRLHLMIPLAILFDLDGTILDSEPIIIQSWKTAHIIRVIPILLWRKEYRILNNLQQNVEMEIPGLISLLNLIDIN